LWILAVDRRFNPPRLDRLSSPWEGNFMNRIIGLGVSALTVASVVAMPSTTTAAPFVSPPLADGLVAPLGLAVAESGPIYVSQLFAGVLSSFVPGGPVNDVAFGTGPESGVAGVEATTNGKVIFTVSGVDGGSFVGLVQERRRNGEIRTLGDVAHHEETVNPDQVNEYGFLDLSDECAAQVPEEIGGYPYSGGINSNAYALDKLRNGDVVVADSGANALLRIDRRGNVSTLAVLPPQGFVIPPEAIEPLGLPECVADHEYFFEPVPTDVELGPDGMLYVTLLPGGPEDASAGARGKVMRVDPQTGAMEEVAGGFLGAVDLAVAPDGTIYVAELFAGRVSRVVRSGHVPVVELHEPGAVEFARGALFVAHHSLSFDPGTGAPLGQVVRVFV
jgi:hypothetical protein